MLAQQEHEAVALEDMDPLEDGIAAQLRWLRLVPLPCRLEQHEGAPRCDLKVKHVGRLATLLHQANLN